MSRRESFTEEEDMAPCGIRLDPDQLKKLQAQDQEPKEEEEEQEPEEKDEFDEFDEQFLKLNNMLEAKHTELKERQEELEAKEKQVAEELQMMRANRSTYLQKATELAGKEELLKNFTMIPPETPEDMNQSYPFTKGLAFKKEAWKYYNKFRELYKFIDARLRRLHENAGVNTELKIQIAACYYFVSFTATSFEEAWKNLNVYHGLVEEIEDEQLEFVNERLFNEVIKPLAPMAQA